MDTLDQRYRNMEPVWKRLEVEAKYIVETALEEAGIKTHSLLSRTKTLDSVKKKSARKQLKDPLASLDDLVGIRVVCLLRSDIARTGELIRQHLKVISEDNKLDGAHVDSFGYQSVHFIVQLPDSYSGPRYRGLQQLRFEIQVRTVAMDTWATLSHYLDYKTESDVPKELRKDFFALSGLFYVADTHFELFYNERQRSDLEARQAALEASTEIQELNLDTLRAFLQQRFPDRRRNDAQTASDLLNQMVEYGYSTLSKLRAALDASAEAFRLYETDHPPEDEHGGKVRFGDVGVVRVSLAILDKKFADARYPQDVDDDFVDPVHAYRSHVRTAPDSHS